MRRGSIYIALLLLWIGCSPDSVVAPNAGATTSLKLFVAQKNFAMIKEVGSTLPDGTTAGVYVIGKKM